MDVVDVRAAVALVEGKAISEATEAATTAAVDAAKDWLEENITNPDSPPLDRSLSVSSSAAPADLVGELSEDIDILKSAFTNNEIDNNAFDILLPIKKTNTNTNPSSGVSFTWNADGTVLNIDTNGSASTGLGINNIFNVNATSFPAGVKPGKKIRILSLNTNENVYVQVFVSTNGTSFPTTPATSVREYSEYTVPSNATGIKIRLATSSGVNLNNLKIKPQILTDAKTNKELLDDGVFPRPYINANTDIDSIKTNGMYLIGAGEYTHNPFPGEASELIVLKTTDNSITQIAVRVVNNAFAYRCSLSGNFPETWKYTFTDQATVPDGTDIDTIRQQGIWFLSSGYTYTHSPFTSVYGGILLVFKYSNNSILQIASKANTGELYTRASLLGNFPETWAMGGTVNNYTTQYYENSYDITCSPTITTDTNNYLASTGDNTDRTGDIQTMLNSNGVCRLGAGKFVVTGINVPDYAALIGNGDRTLLVLADSVTNGYAVKLNNFSSVSDLRINGGSTAQGSSSIVGTRHGILFEGTKQSGQSGGTTKKKSKIDKCTINNFSGGGITCTGTGVDLDSNLLISDCFVDHCGAGMYIPYYSEFHRISNCAFTYNYYGCVDNGGNNNFANCDFSGNKVGILIDNSTNQSPNNSHGTFSGCSVNHSYSDAGVINEGTAIKLLKANLGEIFTGMQIFYGAIVIDDCVGIRFVGANVGSKVPITITDSTVVTFSDCTFKESPTHADSTFTQSNNTVLKFTDCYLRDGTVYNPMA